MPRTLNWQALNARLQSTKNSGMDVEKKRLKNANRVQRAVKRPHSTGPPAKVAHSPEGARSVTPLEHALWTTESQQKTLTVDKHSPNTLSTIPDPRKLAAGKYVAMDCECVGVAPNDTSSLARVTIVNYYGVVLLDAYVKQRMKVTNWRTWVSGIQPHHMKDAISFEAAQAKVLQILRDKIVIGHAVHNDFKVLGIPHPRRFTRDTTRLPEFRAHAKNKVPGLKMLCSKVLGYEVQKGQHSSVEDSQATMALYRAFQKQFEAMEWR